MAVFVFVAVVAFLASIVLAGYWVVGAIKTRSIHSGKRYGRFAVVVFVIAVIVSILTPEPNHLKAAKKAYASRDWQAALGEARSVPADSRDHAEAQTLAAVSLDSLGASKLHAARQHLAAGELVPAVSQITNVDMPGRLVAERDSLLRSAGMLALEQAADLLKKDQYQAAIDILRQIPTSDKAAQAKAAAITDNANKGLRRLELAEKERQRQADLKVLQKGKAHCARKQWDSALVVLTPLVDTLTRKSSVVLNGPCYAEAKKHVDMALGYSTVPSRKQLAADLKREFQSKGHVFEVWTSGQYNYTLYLRHRDIDEEFAQQYLDNQKSLKTMYHKIVLSNGYDTWTWER